MSQKPLSLLQIEALRQKPLAPPAYQPVALAGKDVAYRRRRGVLQAPVPGEVEAPMHPSDLCGYWSIGLPDPNRLSGQDGRDRVLVDELRLVVPAEHKRVAVEPCYMTLKPHAVGQKDRDRNLVLAQVLQNRILERLRVSWTRHDALPSVCPGMAISDVSVPQQAEREEVYPGASPFNTRVGKPSVGREREQNAAAWRS